MTAPEIKAQASYVQSQKSICPTTGQPSAFVRGQGQEQAAVTAAISALKLRSQMVKLSSSSACHTILAVDRNRCRSLQGFTMPRSTPGDGG